MYKININATYFENNLKRIKQPKQGLVKPKYYLTEQQKQFIEMNLPKGYRLNMATQIDQKRNRTPRKADLQFETQFFKRNDKLERLDKKQSSDFDKKIQKREERKEKQRSLIEITKEEQRYKKKYQQLQNLLTQQKQSKFKENNKKQQQQTFIKKASAKESIKSSKYDEQKEVKQIIQPTKKQIQIMNYKKQQPNYQKREYDNIQKSASFKQDTQQNIEATTTLKHELTQQQKQFGIRLINKLKNYKSSWPFRLPVDPITQGVPNYLEIIHEPMDLKTIQKKISANKYQHISELHADINKIFLNSYKFNPRETNYYTLTTELEDYYHQILKQIETNPNILQLQKTGKVSRNKITLNNNEQQFTQESPTKKKRLIIPQTKSLNELNSDLQNQKAQKSMLDTSPKLLKANSLKIKPKFSQAQKKQLVKKIHKISSKALENIVNIAFGQTQDERTIFYLDLQNLSDDALTKIENIIRIDLEKPIQESKNNSSLIQTKMILF